METPEPTSQSEESVFNEVDFSMEGYDKHIRYARITLFIIAGLQLLNIWQVQSFPDLQKWIATGSALILMAAFTALALWTKKKPFTAILVALIVYLTLIAFMGIIDPPTIFQGIIVKIIVVVVLILGLGNARHVERWKDISKPHEQESV